MSEEASISPSPAPLLVPSRYRPNADEYTLRKLLSYLWEDARRKRQLMERPLTRVSILSSFLSINMIAVVIFRASMFLFQKGWRLPSMALYYSNVVLFGFDAVPFSSVGPGFVVAHLNGCAMMAKLGKNCTFYGRNAVGGKGKGDTGGWLGGPVVGDNVAFGWGSNVLTNRSIGDNATIGAGAWVFGEVPPRAIMTGMPARVARYKTDAELNEGFL